MPFSSGLRSYSTCEVTTKIAVSLLLGLVFAVGETPASTPSIAPSVTVQMYSVVSPSAISPSHATLLPSSSTSPSFPLNTSFEILIQLSEITWSEDLFNRESSKFFALATNLTEAILNILKSVGNASVDVVEFKPGSVIAVLKVTASRSQENDMKYRLREEMKNGKIGGFAVDPQLYSGILFDVILQVNFACNVSATDKGFVQKGNLEYAIKTLMSGNQKFTASNIRRIECLEAENITIATVRVQLNDLSALNPNKELSSLKNAVSAGQVGNFSVVPEWKSYLPGEKVFHLSAMLQIESGDRLQTKKELDALMLDKFKSESKFRYANVDMPDNKTVAIDIAMSSSTSELPTTALSPLAGDLNGVRLGNLKLIRSTVRVTIDPTSVTKKIFELNFVRNVPNCNARDVANASSFHYKNLSLGTWEFIHNNIRANPKVSPLYLQTEVATLSCHNATTVRSISNVYMNPNTKESVGLLQFLLKCKLEPGMYDWGLKITIKTPTSNDISGVWNLLKGVWIHWVCYRPPKPKPPTSGTTTEKQTTSSTEPPHNGTKPTGTAETNQTLTTTVIPATPVIKPDLYVKLKLGMAWREFCPEQETLKKMIAGNVHDKSGARVSPDRIIYVNVEKNCADSSKQSELAEVWFYVSKSGSKELHKCLTLKAYQLFKMFFDNGNTKQLGPDFEEKVVQVELAGNSASKYGEKSSGKIPSLTVILIAVAGGVGLFLMLLACCCLFVCGRRRNRRSRKYDSDHPQRLHVIHNDAANWATEGSEGSNGKKVKKDKNENIKKDDSGEEMEVDDGKGGYNAGYEYANENDEDDKNNTDKDNKGNSNKNSVNSGDCSNTKNNANGRDKLTNQGDESATKEPKSSNGDQGGIYGNLKTDGIGEHTYASINKQSDGKCDSGKNGNNVASVPVVVPPFPPIVHGSGLGGGGRGKEGSPPGGISSGIGTGGERQKRGSQSTPVLLRKSDADPKNQDRRGSYVQSLADDDVPLIHKTGTVGIVALAIRNRNEMKKETEFKNLNKDVPSEEVKYPPDTASKNRSPDVLPAPATRVKLPTQPDYINANWIRDHKGQRCYIATQHPLQEIMEDFWRMVWDQQANTVVMVNDEEKDKVAFTDYLPKEEGNSRRFGSIEVAVKQTTEKADHILTVLTIAENKNTASSREVSHFRFTSWKERAMPNVALFVGFVTATREERKKHGDTKAPIIVHCSDGLGFTGVYIAVDIGIKSHEESKKSVVDVFELSKNLRRDRHGIVCSLEHYNFIYQALYEYTVNYDNDK